MKVKEYQPKGIEKDEPTLTEVLNSSTRDVELDTIKTSGWSCNVIEISDSDKEGTLIYVPSVTAEELFPNGGDE